MIVHEMKQGDTKPYLRVQLTEGGAPKNITGATVTFRMAAVAHEPVLDDVPADIINASSGVVEYKWADANATDEAGHFMAEFVVTMGTDVQTFPAGDEYIQVIIGSRLDV